MLSPRKIAWIPLWMAAVSSGFAQLDRGVITGVITDPSGAPVPDARITAIHLNTNVGTSTASTASGNYTLPALPIGVYRVTVEATGFKQAQQENLLVTAGSTIRLDLAMEIGAVTESVQVAARATALETESTRVGTNLSNKLVDDLPLVVAGQMRNVFNLAMVAPEAKSANNYRIGGGQGGGWDMMMDGVSQASASYNYQAQRAPISSVPVDAISEFNVESSGMKAEYGRAMGMISYATKSGSNQMHGNAFEFLRNNAMDARGFFAQSTPVLKQHDFGATGGGPVFIPKLYNGKDRTFFFVGYEGFRNRAGNSPAFYTIPLPEMYQGDFRGWVTSAGAPIQIYDPATTRPNADGSGFVRDPFPGNQIPTTRFSQVAQNYLNIRPQEMVPNRPGPRQNYFLQSGSRVQPWDKGSARIDHRLTSKDSLSFLYVKAQSLDLPLNGIGPGLPAPFTGDGEHAKNNWSMRFTWNRTITARILNSLRFGLQWENGTDTAWSSVDPNAHWAEKLGIQNTTGTDRGLPPIAMTEYTTWGAAQFGFDRGRDVNVADDLSIVAGPHTIKFGVFLSRNRWDGGGQHANNGSFGFSNLATAIPGDQSMRTGNAFASFLLGYVNNASLETPRDVRQIWKYTGGFLQDDWKVSSRLTLNLGLRYEYTFPVVGGAQVAGQDPGFSNFDPTVPNPGAGGIPGALIFTGTGAGRTGGNSPFDGWSWAFSPRIGAAYALGPRTVLRVSGGRFFEAVKTTGGSTHYDGFIGAFSWSSSDLDVNDFPTMLDKGLPAWQQPPFLQPEVANNQSTLAYWDPKVAGRPPEFYSWNFDIQQELPGHIVLSAGYTGTKGTHLISGLADINQLDPKYLTTLGPALLKANITSAAARAAGIPVPYPGFTGTVQQALQRFPQYKYIYSYNGNDGLGNSSYHALVLKVDKRYSSGLTLLGSYVLSKMFSNAESGYPGSTVPLDYYNLRLQKALSSDDQTHVARMAFSYELPAGKGKRYLSQGWPSKVLGNWGLAGFLEYTSGTPMSVSSGYTPPIYPGGSGARVTITSYDNWRAPIAGSSFDPSADLWWNKAAFQQAPQAVLDSALGNATRNNPRVRTPFSYTENISVSKSVPFGEQLRLVVRLEVFNLFNRVRWGAPNSTYTSPSFGLITSQANNPRQMQVGAKLYF